MRFTNRAMPRLHVAPWVKMSADDILNYLSYYIEKIGFDISCKLSLMYM